MKIISKFAVLLALLAAPLSALAQSGINERYLQAYKNSIISVINSILLPVLIALAFITFLWGVYNYFILGADSEDKRKEGRSFVLWGIIGFVIIFSLWGLVTIVRDTLNLQGYNSLAPPTINGGSGSGSTRNLNPSPSTNI